MTAPAAPRADDAEARAAQIYNKILRQTHHTTGDREFYVKGIAAAIAAAAQAARAQALEVAARQVEITDEGFLGLIDSQKAADAIRALAAQPEGGEAK